MPTPNDISTLSRLLDEALALPLDRRGAWLAALPADVAHLQAALRDMLDREAGLVDDPHLRTLPRLGGWDGDDPTTVRPGDRVGPYRLVEEIGRGGMGSVWRAERADGSYQREVALKLPRLSWGEGLARLMAQERDIGAMLEHPHIARLYDAGLDARGWPYLALELIDGRPIDAWCREQRLGVPDKLALLLQVMQALAYAHARLVVHRDIKPSNVLVTPDGHTHLLDFGIAKLLSDAGAGLTEDGARRLTPHYASPEQLRGEPVTAATDVYSLGVLAFELLAGQLPYRLARDTRAAWEEAVLAGEPECASQRCADRTTAKALRGDLDAILAKALQRDPARRYGSVDAFAQDLQRHLRGEPVLAQPDRAWYRLHRALRRHRVAVAATAAVLAALAAGGGLAMRSAQREDLAHQRQRIVTGFATALLRANQAAVFARTDSRHPTPELALADSATLIRQRFPDEPELQAELLGAVARLYLDMDRPALATEFAAHQRSALQRAGASEVQLADASLLRAEAALAGSRWADADVATREALQAAGADRHLRAQALALQAWAAWHGGQPGTALSALRDLQPLLPGLPASSTAPARAQALQAQVDARAGRHEQATAAHQRGIALAVQAEGETSLLAQRLRQSAAAHQLWLGRTDTAAPLVQAAVQALRARGGQSLIESRIVEAEFALARFRRGDLLFAQAEEAMDSARALIDAQAALPMNLLRRLDYARGELALAHGDIDVAWQLMRDNGGHPWDSVGPHEPQMLHMTLVWNDMELATGYRYAAPLHTWAASLRARMGMPNHPDNMGDTARMALLAGRAGNAQAGMAVLAAVPATDATGLLAWVRAQLLLDLGRPQEAAQAVQGLTPGPLLLPPEVLTTESVAAQLDCAQGRAAAGRDRLAAEAQALLRDRNPAAPGPAWLRAHAGLCALAAGDVAGARRFAQQARQAFTAQAEVADYFKRPLLTLEARLRRH